MTAPRTPEDRCPDCGMKLRTGRHTATCPRGPLTPDIDEGTYSASRTSSAGTDFTYRPRPQSWLTVNDTDARHSPVDGHRTQPSCQPGTHSPSCKTSTARGSGKRRTSSDTTQKVGQR